MKYVEYKKKVSIGKLDESFNEISKRIEKLTLSKGFSESVLYAISELFDNIKQHSGTKESSIKIEINSKNSFIEIEDYGIGMRNSYISKGFYPKDDFSAIEFALGGLSTKDLSERGFGLYSLRKMSNALKGKMIIKTGNATVTIEKDRFSFKKNSKFFKGTSVKLELPVRKINFYQVIE